MISWIKFGLQILFESDRWLYDLLLNIRKQLISLCLWGDFLTKESKTFLCSQLEEVWEISHFRTWNNQFIWHFCHSLGFWFSCFLFYIGKCALVCHILPPTFYCFVFLTSFVDFPFSFTCLSSVFPHLTLSLSVSPCVSCLCSLVEPSPCVQSGKGFSLSIQCLLSSTMFLRHKTSDFWAVVLTWEGINVKYGFLIILTAQRLNFGLIRHLVFCSGITAVYLACSIVTSVLEAELMNDRFSFLKTFSTGLPFQKWP